uniref:thiamine diphosphokinase n=1 Tax=Elaeis guineensis var. tenera TaxID=51953 RepID=A0A6J0PR76_ELAGV|nr:thiamine pyrophosphokinase 1 isoform X2 [Elaeis guineensis]
MEVMRHASTFLLPSSSPPTGDGPALTYALVVLNQRLPRFAPLLWSRAQLRVCADGGANRIYDGLPELFPDQDPLDVRLRYKPDVIKGDMDSIRDDVKEFYSNLEVKIVDESHDQDTTDLHKCVAFVCNSIPDPEKSNCSYAFLLWEHLVEGLIMKLETSMFYIGSQTSGLFFYQMIA